MAPRTSLVLVTLLAGVLTGTAAPGKAQTTASPPSPLLAQQGSGSQGRSTAHPYVLVHVNAAAGSDGLGNGSQMQPFKTISHALENASTGTVILLAPGEYSEATGESFPIQLRSGVTVQGSPSPGQNGAVIRGGGTYLSPSQGMKSVTLLAADRAGLGNVVVTNPYSQGHGVWIEGGSPVLQDNVFAQSGQSGVYIVGAGTPLIQRNYFTANGVAGLVIGALSQAEVQGNVFENTGIGIQVAPGAAPRILENRIVQNQDGLILQADARPVLENNVIARNRRNGLVEFQTSTQAAPQAAVLPGGSPSQGLVNLVPNVVPPSSAQVQPGTGTAAEPWVTAAPPQTPLQPTPPLAEMPAASPIQAAVVEVAPPQAMPVAPQLTQPLPEMPVAEPTQVVAVEVAPPQVTPAVQGRTAAGPASALGGEGNPGSESRSGTDVALGTAAAGGEIAAPADPQSILAMTAQAPTLAVQPPTTPTGLGAPGVPSPATPALPELVPGDGTRSLTAGTSTPAAEATVPLTPEPVQSLAALSSDPVPTPVQPATPVEPTPGSNLEAVRARIAANRQVQPATGGPDLNETSGSVELAVIPPPATASAAAPIAPAGGDLTALRERLARNRAANSGTAPGAAPGSAPASAVVAISVTPPPVETVARANAGPADTASALPLIPTEAALPTAPRPEVPVLPPPGGALPLLQVPGPNIPMGNGGGSLPDILVSSNSTNGGPPAPPSRSSSLGLHYKVFVPAADEAAQSRVRTAVPDAFRVRFNGQVMMQAGAFPDQATADAIANNLIEQGLDAKVQYVP